MTTVHGEIKSDLGKKLQTYRTDRPDEWTMDEFTREAEKMQARNTELKAALNRISRLTNNFHVINAKQIADKALGNGKKQ